MGERGWEMVVTGKWKAGSGDGECESEPNIAGSRGTTKHGACRGWGQAERWQLGLGGGGGGVVNP